MKQKYGRMISIILTVCMVFSLFGGVPVHAETADELRTGLLATDAIDWNWSDEAGADMPSLSEEASYQAEMWADLPGTTLSLKYVAADGSETPLSAKDIVIERNEGTDEAENFVKASEETATCRDWNGDPDSGFVEFSLTATGTYRLCYTPQDGEPSYVTMWVEYPVAGFYRGDTVTAEDLICDDLEYSNQKTFYLLFADKDATITDTVVTVENADESVAKIEAVEENKSYLITIAGDVIFDFDIRVTYNCQWSEEEEARPEERWLHLYSEESRKGLFAADWIDWQYNETLQAEEFIVNEQAEYGKECWWELPARTVSLKYTENVDTDAKTEGIAVSANDITVKVQTEDGTWKVDDTVTVETNVDNNDYVDVSFAGCGTYRLCYTQDEITSYVTVTVEYPVAGFYAGDTVTAENLIRDDLEYSKQKIFYVLFADRDATITDAVVTVENTDPSAATIEPLKENKKYKITIADDVLSEFDIKVTYNCQWPGEEEANREERSLHLYSEESRKGLLAADWFEWTWNDQEQTDVPALNDQAEYGKECGWAFPRGMAALKYAEDADTDVKENGTIVYAKDITVKVQDENGTWMKDDTVTVASNPYDNTFTEITFAHCGRYRLCYQAKDDAESYVSVTVDLPMVGYYTSPERSEEGLLTDQLDYAQNRTFYLLFADSDATISDVAIDLWDYRRNAVTVETLTENKAYKITVDEKVGREFNLRASYQCCWPGEDPEEKEQWLNLYYGGKYESVMYTDGVAHVGYAGCYITKDEFEEGEVDYTLQRPLYWVHADTIQGVIDKLASVSAGEDILFNPEENPEGNGQDKVTGVVNTGYIHINVSHFGDMDLAPQYVSSSGNMLGIQFEAGQDHYFTIPDKENHQLLGANNDVYVEDAVCRVTDVRENTYGLQVDDLISIYRGEVYRVENVGVAEGKEYYALAEKIDGLSDDQVALMPDMEDEDTSACVITVEYYLMPSFQFPELHVNLYCDMVFVGGISNLYIGLQEDSDCEARIFSERVDGNEIVGREVLGTYDYKAGGFGEGKVTYDLEPITICYQDSTKKYGYDTKQITPHLFKIHTTAEADETSTYEADGEKVTVAAPEPNALTQLTEEQKSAVEAGKQLTVSMKADSIDTASALKEEVKEAVDKIKEELGQKNAAFLDLTVSAKVADVDGSTKITETKAPMQVTVPLSPELRNKASYSVVCYHTGVGGNGEIYTIDAALSEDGKSLTFATSRFSVYAIAYEEKPAEKADFDLSKAAWNYKEAFTYDGAQKKVEITGLPQGLTVSYTGNTATEAGNYTAKATFSYDKEKYNAPDTTKLATLSWSIVKKTEEVVTPPAKPEKPEQPKAGDTSVVNGVTYEITSVSDTQKTVSYVGGTNKKAKSVTIPSTVTINGTTYQVTKIGKNAFKNYTSLKKITIPKNITEIGDNAFYGCKKITSVKFSGTKLTKIGAGAFRKCSSLKSVTIPAGVSQIGKDAFRDCKKLSKIAIKGTKVKTIGKNAFSNIAKKPTITVPKKKKAAYKKLLKKAGYKKTVK